jgi:hypothetical protein
MRADESSMLCFPLTGERLVGWMASESVPKVDCCVRVPLAVLCCAFILAYGKLPPTSTEARRWLSLVIYSYRWLSWFLRDC